MKNYAIDINENVDTVEEFQTSLLKPSHFRPANKTKVDTIKVLSLLVVAVVLTSG